MTTSPSIRQFSFQFLMMAVLSSAAAGVVWGTRFVFNGQLLSTEKIAITGLLGVAAMSWALSLVLAGIAYWKASKGPNAES